MTQQYRASPTYQTPLQIGNNIAQAWWRWFQAVQLGTPPAAEIPITVGRSPFDFIANQGGFVLVRAGSVSSIHFFRTSDHLTGLVAGIFPMSNGDQLTVTYSVKPIMVFVPQ
jgi:hypothetical protein